MSIFKMFSLKDFDLLFSQNPNAVIINRANFSEKNFADSITQLVFADNQSDDIGFVAKCECGSMVGNYYIGKVCKCCQSEVKPNFVDELQHKVWIATPSTIKAFLHPIVYFVVSNWLSHSKGSYIDDLLNPKSKLPEDLDAIFKGRGFNYVHDNWDFIMNYFLNIYAKTKRKKQVPYMRMFLDYYQHLVFPSKLPILSNELHPITREGKTLKYTDDSSGDILQVIIDLSTIEFFQTTTMVSQSKIDRTMFKCYMSYIEYLKKIIRKKLAVKKAIIRHHVFGTRLHGTFRSVIVPITGEHYGDELHVPWNIGVSTYKHMIINILMNRKHYSLAEALAKISCALIMYDWEIDQIIQTLIKECGYREYDSEKKNYKWVDLPGLPVLLDRNPSMRMGAIQLLFITKVKPGLKCVPLDQMHVSVHDETIAMSPLIVKDPNADFDGDALNGIALFEVGETKKYLSFHPANRMLSSQYPEAGSSNVLAKQEILMLNNWANAEEEELV